MKDRKIEIASFLAGFGIFIFLIQKFGLDQIILNMRKAGWSLFYAILVWFVIYLLNTVAWKLALVGEGKKISFRYLFLVTVSGFVINYITPFLAIGGEPYRVKKLSAALNASRSLSAVVLYRMIHLLGHMLLLLTGIIAALIMLRLPAAVVIGLVISALIIIAIVSLTFIGQNKGLFRWLQTFLSRFRFLRKPASALEQHRGELEAMDALLTDAYQNHRSKFYLALFAEYLSRALMGLEMYVILTGVGLPITPVGALFIYIMYSIAINIFFFVPFNIGAREGGVYLGLESLALPPLMGIYFGVVMRIREFFWILMGLLFILITDSNKHSSTVPVS